MREQYKARLLARTTGAALVAADAMRQVEACEKFLSGEATLLEQAILEFMYDIQSEKFKETVAVELAAHIVEHIYVDAERSVKEGWPRYEE